MVEEERKKMRDKWVRRNCARERKKMRDKWVQRNCARDIAHKKYNLVIV